MTDKQRTIAALNAKLRPCPFCGGDGHIVPRRLYAADPVDTTSGWAITCKGCGVITKIVVPDIYNALSFQSDLLDMWNQRQADGNIQWDGDIQ